MKRSVGIFWLCFILFAGHAFAAELARSNVPSLIEQGRISLAASPQSALHFADSIRQSDKGLAGKDPLRLAVADWISAAALVHQNKAGEALSFVQRGLTLINKIAPSSSLYGEMLVQRGNALSLNSDIQGAIRDYQLAYGVFRKSGSGRGQAESLLDIAANYLDAGDYRAAIRYCREALDAYSGNPMIRLSAHNNAAIAFVKLGRFKDAEAEYKLALSAAKAVGDPVFAVRVLANIGQTQADAGESAAAESTIQAGFALAQSGLARNWQPALFAVAAKLALKQQHIKRAEFLIDKAFEGEGAGQAVMPVRDYHETAYQIYRASDKPDKALAHLEAFKSLDDEARALAASTNAALMSARFDFANQDLKIARLRTGQAERDATLAKTRVRYHLILATGLLGAVSTISILLLIGYISISRSRSKVQAANDTLHQTNTELQKALAVKGEFLATTSHEIRTPLNGILGMTQVLLVDRSLAAPVRDRVELIHGAGETMRALVDDILDMAKIESGELRIHPAPMDLHRLLRDSMAVWSGQAQTKRLALELELGDSPTGIVADEVRLRQIIFNLVSNAIKFTDAGLVRIVADAERHGDGELLSIKVQDSGIGIPADRLADVFESFQQVDGGVTRRHGGTGLGLSICRSLARAMGGEVSVSSVLGAGSAFTVELPLDRAHVGAVSCEPSAGSATSLAEASILLIEPNPLSQGILRALLGSHVRECEIVADLEAASAALSRGGVHHVLVDGAVFELDALETVRFARTCPAPRVTVLWPMPDLAVSNVLESEPRIQLIAKPIAAADLLAALRMGYRSVEAGRDIAA